MFEEHYRFCSDCARFSYPDDSLVCSGCLNKPNKPNWAGKTEFSSGHVYWERICRLYEKQRAKGNEKYGYGLESNPAGIVERINHLQEELLDGLMYCEWIKEKILEGGVNDGDKANC